MRAGIVGWAITLGLVVTPAIAHEVQTSGNVGGTMHLEPNHNPRARQPSTVWFALSRRGGETISLTDCNCQLSVYIDSERRGAALQNPPLSPISAERYSDMPGATITFPTVGIYTLVLQGRPVTDNDFEPFELRYDVTVAR